MASRTPVKHRHLRYESTQAAPARENSKDHAGLLLTFRIPKLDVLMELKAAQRVPFTFELVGYHHIDVVWVPTLGSKPGRLAHFYRVAGIDRQCWATISRGAS